MRKSARRFGRPAKTTEEIIAEFQDEWDEEDYRDETDEEEFEEEYSGETYDGEPIEMYEELYPEDEEDASDFAENVNEVAEIEHDSQFTEEELEEEYDPKFAEEELEEEYELEFAEGELEEECDPEFAEELEEKDDPEFAEEELEEEYDPEFAEKELEEEYDLECTEEELEEKDDLEFAEEGLEEEYDPEFAEELEEEYDPECTEEELEEEYDPEFAEEELEEECDPEFAEEELEEEYDPEFAEEELEEEYDSEFAEDESDYGEYVDDPGGEELESDYEDYEGYISEYVEEETEPEYYEDEETYGKGDMTLSSRRRNAEEEEDSDQDKILDKFILIAGVAVLLMAVITGIVFITSRMRSNPADAYQEVGAHLVGVNLIGGQGLDAVSNAQQVYAASLLAAATPEPVITPAPQGYDEQEYQPDINVQMNFSSIEKDLKIKFVNKETGKLISNVPFSINITDPGGSTIMWSDDDMDGIIYKKNLTPGQYRLVMNALTDEKYKSYGLVTTEQKTEVKKEIEYKKVDVSDEVKTESQVNVAKEDTKINETLVESYLQDTVAWVESTSTMITYAEVAKSNIPDPMTLALSGSFVRLSQKNPGTAFLPTDLTAPLSAELLSSSTMSSVVEPLSSSAVPLAAEPTSSSITPPAVESSSSSAVPFAAEPLSGTTVPWAAEPLSEPAALLSTELMTEPTAPPLAEPTTEPTAPPLAEPTTEPTTPPSAEPTTEPTTPPSAEPTTEPTAPPLAEPTTEPTASPSTEPTAPPTIPPSTEPPAVVLPTPVPVATSTPTTYVGRIEPASKTLKVGEQFSATVACDGVTIQSITWMSSNPAAVTVDGSGTVTAVSATQQPVLISYMASGVDSVGNVVRDLTASCSVTVSGGDKNLKLDKATELVYTGASINLTATLENGTDTDVLTVESSDGNVAKAEISGRTITVTGLGAGTANITVKYTENNNTISAVCTVTVKQNAREDRTSLLKDKDGNELYVQENNNYRQAVYADYYTFDKFFKKGEARYTGWQTIGGVVKYFDINGNAVTGEQIIQGVKYNFASDGSLMVGSGTMGIDVSRWNGSIDWNAVKNSGVSYVIIRCGYRGSSQGTLIVDPMFQSNIKGATDAGLKVGIYFFTQAIDKVEAVEEASMVLELIKNYRISYPVFLDVEPSGGRADGISIETRTEVCKTFCQTIQNGGYTAGIYANKTWLTEKINTSQLGAYKIWLAQYASVPTYTGRYDLWQYKSTGKVSGITGDVDLNLSYLGY